MSGIDEVQVDREIRFDTIEEAVADLKAGKMIVVLDAEDRENEGDVVCAAETITPAHVELHHPRGARAACACRCPRTASRGSASIRW